MTVTLSMLDVRLRSTDNDDCGAKLSKITDLRLSKMSNDDSVIDV